MNIIEQAEKEFAAYYGKKHGIMMCNGTATLHCCLLATGVVPGDEVIVPALTMASPALAVRYCGARPVYADVCKSNFHIDWYKVRSQLNSLTKAVVPVSIYGYSNPYADFWGGKIRIQDNAQCLSPEFGNCDMASFSFQETKHISTGEGGMVLTDADYLVSKIRMYSNLGYSCPIDKDEITNPQWARHNVIGYNYRPSEAQAKLLLEQIPKIPERIKRRQDVAQFFRTVCEDSVLVPQAHSDNHSYWTFAAYLKRGNWKDFVKLFKKNGGDRVYGAWRLPYQEPALYDDTQRCPVAEYLQPRMLQFKTNYEDMKVAEKQAKILKKTIEEF